MTNRAQATAAPGEIRIGDKTYQMSPLSDKDIGELDNWIRVRVVRLARQSLIGGETSAERRETMQAAFEYATSLTWLDKGAEEMATLEGAARLLWQVLKKNHPELEVQDLEVAIVDGTINIDESMDTFDLLHGTVDNTGKKKQPRVPKRGGKRKAKKSVGMKSTRS